MNTAQAQSASAPANAASAPTFLSAVTGNINVTSNDQFRGQDQGSGKGGSPAVQGGFDWSQNGFYVGNWNSHIGFAGSIELDLDGGYKGEIATDFGYDVGILQYDYPKNGGGINFNTTEIDSALSYSFMSLKHSQTVSNDCFGIGREQEGAASARDRRAATPATSTCRRTIRSWPKLTLNAQVGNTRCASGLRKASFTTDDGEGGVTTTDTGVSNYADCNLGVTYDLGSGFSAAGAVVGASKRSFDGDINTTRAIVALSKALWPAASTRRRAAVHRIIPGGDRT